MKAGYRPKTVRLHYIADDPALIARCHRLQADMLSWASGGNGAPHYDGTVASLVRLYETHENSSYRDIEQSTQRAYSKALALWIVKHTGNRLVEAVTGNDVRQWFKKLVASGLSVNTAYFAINVFKVALAFGSSLRLAGCRELREELRDTRFFGGQRRTEQLTYEQMTTLRDKARAMGLHYLARCIVLQFEFAMRRRDVIGKWYTDGAGTDGIRHGKRVWRDGLTWADKDDDGVIRRVVSKTRRTTAAVAVHAIGDYPNVAEELARTPAEARIGPLVIHDKTGLPPTEEQCRYDFRRVAQACGIPAAVKMMDARAGANTEAYAAGATQEEAMALATHSEAKTNERYLRELADLSHQAAVKRVAARKK